MLRDLAGSVIRRIKSIPGLARAQPPDRKSGIFPVRLPLAPDEKTGWKPYAVFSKRTLGGEEIASHVSVLSPGKIPHPPHRHPEEEILLLLSGGLETFTSEEQVASGTAAVHLRPGQLYLYPAGFTHTIRSSGREPAQYLMVKWASGGGVPGPHLPPGLHNLDVPAAPGNPGFRPHLLFEGATSCMHTLHCHVTRLDPGAGYPPHADPYDVVIVMLEGTAVTLGTVISAHDVVFYRAGEPHGMQNPAASPARYLVCEFHW